MCTWSKSLVSKFSIINWRISLSMTSERQHAQHRVAGHRQELPQRQKAARLRGLHEMETVPGRLVVTAGLPGLAFSRPKNDK